MSCLMSGWNFRLTRTSSASKKKRSRFAKDIRDANQVRRVRMFFEDWRNGGAEGIDEDISFKTDCSNSQVMMMILNIELIGSKNYDLSEEVDVG